MSTDNSTGNIETVRPLRSRSTYLYLLLIFNFMLLSHISAQVQANNKKKEIDELRLKLNEDGSHYVKFNVLGQLWFRFNESNPGTTVQKEPATKTFDIGIRRLRFQLFGQLTDHAFFYIHFGQDNFNFLASRKFVPFIQDALAEYKVKTGSEALIFGGGLTIAAGAVSFYPASASQHNALQTCSVFAFPTFDLTDQSARKLSIYARGQVAKLDYRIIISNPFPISSSGITLPPLVRIRIPDDIEFKFCPTWQLFAIPGVIHLEFP